LEKSLSRQRAIAIKAVVVYAAVLCSLLTYTKCGAYEDGGQSGAYLQLPVGATATALGGAYTAAADYYAAWWNPSALGFLREKRIAGGAGIRSLGRVEGYGAFDFRIPPRVGMGIVALYRGDPSIDNLHDPEDNILPSASYTTMTVKCAVSYRVTRKLSAGISTNFLYQSLPDYADGGGIRSVSASTIGAFDAAITYRMSTAWTFAAVLQNMLADMEWQMGDYEPPVSDKPLRSLVLAGSYLTTLREKPLLWVIDCKGYVFDTLFHLRDYPDALLNTGVEWRGWNTFYLRAGLGDIPLSGQLVNDSKAYFKEFTMRFSLGFSREMSEIKKGLWLNYAAATDKVWAGIDQQLDVTFAF
jgi:hypothetical protein